MWDLLKTLQLPISFKRQYAQPLDYDAVFETLADMQTYLSNPVRYQGQIATCLETNKIYHLNAARDAWIDGLSAISASQVAIPAAGNISSTNVKDAIYELDSEKQPKNLTSEIGSSTITDNNSLLGFWDTTNSIFKKITWANFKSIFVNLTDINVSSWSNGEQRLLLARNNNGVPAFDGAAELLDIYAPPTNAATLLVDSGWSNEQKTITGDNTLGQLGRVGQILWLDNKTFCQVISATYTSNASVTYYRNRCFDNLDPIASTQDATVLNALDPSYTYPAMTSTGNSTDLGWDLATQTKVLTVAARVGTWAVGGLSGEGYTYMCFKVSGSNTYWKRIGNPSFIQREITEASHPSLVAALRAYDWTLGKYTQSGLEVSYQDQTFSDDTKGYYYIKTDSTKWSRFEVLSSPKKVTVTNAQLKALATTAVTVVAQPASEYANFVRGIVLSFKAGTEALTVDATTIFVVRYVGGQTIATIAATAFVDSTTNKVRHTTQITISDSTSGVDNKAIEIINTGTQISGNASNNATLDVLINYTTVKL